MISRQKEKLNREENSVRALLRNVLRLDRQREKLKDDEENKRQILFVGKLKEQLQLNAKCKTIKSGTSSIYTRNGAREWNQGGAI